MFNRYTFPCDQIFKLEINNLTFPFNLTFKPAGQSVDRANFRGPGVYILSYSNQVIYVGSYKSTNTVDVRYIRWARHLETITLRGKRIGFGKKIYDNIAKELHPDFQVVFTRELLADRLIDTGVVTSINRISFALEQWNDFSKFDDNLLGNFSFEYFKFDEQNDTNRQRVCQIENELIMKINPRCNRQYSDRRTLCYEKSCQEAEQLFNLP